MDEVYQDGEISTRISDQVVQYEAANVHQITIAIDGCKCVTHSMVSNQNNSSSPLDTRWKASCDSKSGHDGLV